MQKIFYEPEALSILPVAKPVGQSTDSLGIFLNWLITSDTKEIKYNYGRLERCDDQSASKNEQEPDDSEM